jgi:hypothetical protein
MASSPLRNSLIAILAFTVAAILIVASAFAADGKEGKSKHRVGNGQLNTGTFQIVVPKADRDGSGRKVARILGPKSELGPNHRSIRASESRSRQFFQSHQTVPGVAQSAAGWRWPRDREARNAEGSARGTDRFWPRSTSRSLRLCSSLRRCLPLKVEQGSSAPVPVETKSQPAVVASEAPAPVPMASEADKRQVELAYIRAAQRYSFR